LIKQFNLVQFIQTSGRITKQEIISRNQLKLVD